MLKLKVVTGHQNFKGDRNRDIKAERGDREREKKRAREKRQKR